jgi:hypothetical protein
MVNLHRRGREEPCPVEQQKLSVSALQKQHMMGQQRGERSAGKPGQQARRRQGGAETEQQSEQIPL